MFNSRHPQHQHHQQHQHQHRGAQPATLPPNGHEHQHHGAVVVDDAEALALDKDLKQLKQALVGGLGVAAAGATAAVKQLLLQQHHHQEAASSTSPTFFTAAPHPHHPHHHHRMDEEEEEESEEGTAAHQPPGVVVGNEHLRDHLYTQLRTSNSNNNSNRADEEIKEEEEERNKQQQQHHQQLANNHHHDFHQLSMLLDEAAEEGISQFPPLGEASVAAIAQNLLSSLQHPPSHPHPHPSHEETLVHPHLSHHHQQQHHEGRGEEEEGEDATNALLQEQHEQGPQVSHHLSHFPPLGVQPVDFRSALELNRQFQAVLKEQLRNIEEARHRNQELQKRLRSVIAQNKKSGAIANAAAAAAAGGGRKGAAAGVLAPPAIFGSRIGPHKKGTSYFTTSDGMTPPDNQDAIRRRRLLEKVQSTLKAKKWSKQELNQLRQGIRQANQQIMFNRLMELYHMGQKTVEMFNCETEIIRNLSAEELEKNTEGIEWENISKNFVPSRSAIDCKIQWLQNQHPSINKRAFTKQEDKRLLELAKIYKGHDWETIARELGTNRTPVQCFKRYQRSLNTNMMRSKWTEEENKTLVEAVKRYGEKNWQQVANCLEGRTGQQCLHRWQKTLNPEIRRGRWTAHEDMLLTLAVKAYGHKNWIKIQSHVPGRTDVQCRERWMNVLNPGVNNGPWTNEEDEKLREAIAQHGLGKWSQVAQMMPMRTDNQCWRRWKTLNSQDLVHYKRVIFKKKKGMVSNFVGREKERPELTPDDFEIEEGEEREGAMNEGAVVGGGEEEEGPEQLQQQQQEQMTAVMVGDEEEHGHHHHQQQDLVVIEREADTLMA